MATIDYQICLAQATAEAEVWTSIKDVGGSGTRRETYSGSMDYATFTVNSATALTDPALFAYHAVVRLRKVVDGVPSYWFVGRIASNIPRTASGSKESYPIRVEGPWSWFEACTFRQPWAAAGGGRTKPRVILFCDASGARTTTGAQIIQAAEFARAAGCPIAEVTSATVATGFTPPFDEQLNIKVADVICNALSYHPHATCWFDYSQRDAVFHVATRQSLPSVSLSIIGRDNIEVTARYDIQAPAVALCYEQNGSVDGSPVIATTLDWAPVVSGESDATRDARLAQADVIWACYSLQGAAVTTASQILEVEAFPSNLNTLAWWKARVPTMSEYADEDIAISNARRLNDSSLSNILLQGVTQPWMTTVSIEKERVRCDFSFIRRATIDGVSTVVERGTKSITLEIWVTGASAGQRIYREPVSIDAGEPVPTGIAAALYSEWSQLHYQGQISFRSDELPGTATPGHSLNLTDGLEEWETMAAMIIRCSEDADTGETSVEFGVPNWIDVDSRVAFARATRLRNTAESRVWRTGLTSNGVTGSNAEVVDRDGSVGSAFVRQVYASTSTPRHMVVIDADAFSKSADASVASIIAPREVYLPFVDTSDGNKVKARLAQVMASALYGSAIAVGTADPVIPAAFDAQPAFWGEYATASGGGSVPSSNVWVASGVYGHNGNGFRLLVVMRSYIDNSAATPSLYSEQAMLQFSADGRLLACSLPYAYVISPTIAV